MPIFRAFTQFVMLGYLFALLLGVLPFLGKTQDSIPAGPFVKLNKSDSLLFGGNLSYDPKFLRSSTITLDGRIMKTAEVSLFCDNEGVLFNRVDISGFYKSVHKYKNINVYKVIRTSYSNGVNTVSQRVVYYYSIGLGKTRKVNFGNLKKDFNHDAAGQALIRRGRAYQFGGYACFIPAATLTIIAAIHGVEENGEVAPFAVGAVTLYVASFVFFVKSTKNMNALKKQCLNF